MDRDSLKRELQVLQERDFEIGQSRKGQIEVPDCTVVSRPYKFPDFEPYVDFPTGFVLSSRRVRELQIRFFFNLRRRKARIISFCAFAFNVQELKLKRFVKRLINRSSVGVVESRHE